MTIFQTCRHHFTTLLVCCLFTLAACGGGGGDGDVAPAAPATLTISGTAVSSNNGSLAKLFPRQGVFQWFASLFVSDSFAQAVGLGPVRNARVVVFKINDNGTVQTSAGNLTGIIAESTTDANGFYRVTLPASFNPASDLIVQVSNAAAGTAPASIPSLNVINAPASQSIAAIDQAFGRVINVYLTPGTEVATREMIARVQATSGTLANFTTQETTAFTGLLASSSLSITAATLPQTLADIKTQLQPVITEALNLIAPPGTVNQSTLTGSYAVARFFAGLDIANSRTGRYLHAGTAMLDGAAGTFTLPFAEEGSFLGEMCGVGGDLCQRTFVTSLTLNRTDTMTGSFLYLPSTNQVVFTDSSGDVLTGSTNPDGTVVLLPFMDGRRGIGMGFGLAIKKGSNLTTADILGTYNFAEFGSEVSPTGSSTGSWQSPINSYTGTGAVSFVAPSIVNVAGAESTMTQTINCTIGGPQGCTISGTLGNLPEPITLNGTFSVASDGSFTITNPGPPVETTRGTLGGDKNLALIPFLDVAGGAVAVSVKQSTGLTNAGLNGLYSLLMFRDTHDTLGHLTTTLYTGTVTFNGSGGHTVAVQSTFADLADDCIGGACGYHVNSNIGSTPTPFNASGSYSVTTGTNAVSITVPGLGTFSGFAMPGIAAPSSASFLYTTETFDSQPRPGGGNHSGRTIALLVKR
ncbi:MAG: hypothetical protein Q8N04_14085 [Nitrospira sp.]|nr:hypothetical protein [Nitrospira sp.]